MPAAPTSRLRSKTSDLSDPRGKSAEPKHPEARSTPPAPEPAAEAATPTKGKLNFGFFSRRRKSSASSTAPSISRKSTDTRGNADSEVPPVPPIDVSRLSSSTITPRRSLSSPSSPTTPTARSYLPSLTVASPSSDAAAHAATQARGQPPSRASYSGQTPDPQKATSTVPGAYLRQLRPQKSTSFEFTRRSSNDTTASSSGGRPIITISAPPVNVEDDRDRFTTPRTAPAPPPTSSTSRIARKAFATPTSSPSPPSSPPSFMRFHRPPSNQVQRPVPPPKDDPGKRRLSSEPRSHGLFSSRKSTSTAPPPVEPPSPTGPSPRDRIRSRPSALPLSLPKLKPKQEKPQAVIPKRSVSGMSTTSQSASDSGQGSSPSPPTTRRKIPISPSSMKPPLTKPLPPVTATSRRLPSAGPPTEPLPSPPPGAAKSPEEHPFPALPTIPSYSSVGRKSVISIATKNPRSRTSTVSSLASSASAVDRSDTTRSSPADEREEDKGSLRPPGSVSDTDEPAGEPASVEQLRDALNAQSAKYARLSAYLLTLTERHAVEKSELARRIEALEREARKREREVTGLRWLVMNANLGPTPGEPSGRAAARAAPSPSRDAAGRMRSGSKASQQSYASGAHDSPVEGRGAMSVDSHTGSIEEGLFEMQRSVSDFIAPATSPPPAEVDALPSPRPPGGTSLIGQHKRSNTLPDSLSVEPAKRKEARRTSSPLIAGASGLSVSSTGLGISVDMPSIPSLPWSDDGHANTTPPTSTSAASSLPSLAAVNTASSGLSAIPESPGRLPENDKEQERREKEERRASRALKRISASSSSASSVPASSTAYSNNLKVGTSPSIGQVLDSATDEETDMDTILRKLRTFGS
ncbi:hypothetical protein B0H21DRAFT_821511 [Amylocystis lapponica]|nr:hypothetical protein B0H21DRAFT_821511 [Amylocystis lapponica]